MSASQPHWEGHEPWPSASQDTRDIIQKSTPTRLPTAQRTDEFPIVPYVPPHPQQVAEEIRVRVRRDGRWGLAVVREAICYRWTMHNISAGHESFMRHHGFVAAPSTKQMIWTGMKFAIPAAAAFVLHHVGIIG